MIDIERLTKRYVTTAVVDDVSMTVAEGTITAVVGASGSGKTTLMRMVNRLVEPTSGVVRLAGEDTATLEPHELRRRIGYAIQNHGLFPHRTIAQNVGTTPKLLGWDSARTAARVDELLTLFQLDPAVFRDRYPHELSGGQQQRVGVARALAAAPRVLLMDEPFGALDPVIRAKAQADLRDIQRRLGVTVVIVTHDMEEAIRLGDRIAVMDKGLLLQHAAPAEILGRPADRTVEALVGTVERPFRLLALGPVGDLAVAGVADGSAIPAAMDRRAALATLIWEGRTSAPVAAADGAPMGVITLDRLTAAGAKPA